jgi:hypothetical protein
MVEKGRVVKETRGVTRVAAGHRTAPPLRGSGVETLGARAQPQRFSCETIKFLVETIRFSAQTLGAGAETYRFRRKPTGRKRRPSGSVPSP